MTEKTFAHNSSGQQIKTPGWFSWRHRTPDAHSAARARYLSLHGPAARRRRAAERGAR